MEIKTGQITAAQFEEASAVARELFRRCGQIPSGVELTNRAIREALGCPPYDTEFVKDNFSRLVRELQVSAYGYYLAAESEVCGGVLGEYVKLNMETSSADGAINALRRSFLVLDRFFLSLTQSRRQRAGASFEAVVQTLFRALDYPYSPQPELSGSRPDFVMPSIAHYRAFAADCIIFTCKRTLRERWRQVVTEGLTGQAFYLATIDEGISVPELQRMKDRNVIVVVPDTIKANFYAERLNVIRFEDFFDHHLDPAVRRWKATGVV